MGDHGVRCGNCGALNGATEQFCVSCGVLLAAYQSPSGAQPSADDSQAAEPARPEPEGSPRAAEPMLPPPPTADASAATPDVTMPEPGDATAKEPHVAHSVDEIFGARPDVEEFIAGHVSAPPDPVFPTPQPALDEEPPEPTREETNEATGTPQRQDVAARPIEVKRPPSGTPARAGSGAAPRSSPIGWNQSDRGRAALSGAGRRVDATPPQTLIVVGGMLILAACVLGSTATAVDLPLLIAGPLWCAFPIGVILLVIGVIQLASRRPNRF